MAVLKSPVLTQRLQRAMSLGDLFYLVYPVVFSMGDLQDPKMEVR